MEEDKWRIFKCSPRGARKTDSSAFVLYIYELITKYNQWQQRKLPISNGLFLKIMTLYHNNNITYIVKYWTMYVSFNKH